jgi:hypothetical protein
MGYNDILRGPQLQKAYEKYKEYLEMEPDKRREEYKKVAKPKNERVKPKKEDGYILPFADETGKLYVAAQVLAESQDGAGSGLIGIVRTLLKDYFAADLPTSTTDLVVLKKVENFTFAQLRVTQRKEGSAADENARSRKTGRSYSRWRTESVTGSFGKKPGATGSDNDYTSIVKLLSAKKELQDIADKPGGSFTFIPELE